MRPNRTRARVVAGALIATAAVVFAGSAQAAAPSAASAGVATAGNAPCRPSLPVGESTITVESGGIERTVLVYVPERAAQSANRKALVLTLHGSFSNAAEQLTRSGLAATADKEGFVVAAPQGALTPAEGLYYWNVPGVTGPPPNQSLPDDEQFMRDVVAALAAPRP